MSSKNQQNYLFSSRLTAALKKAGKTKRDLADALGVFPQSLTRYKNGKSPNADLLLRISHHLNISMNWLMGDGEINRIDYLAGENLPPDPSLNKLKHLPQEPDMAQLGPACEHLAASALALAKIVNDLAAARNETTPRC